MAGSGLPTDLSRWGQVVIGGEKLVVHVEMDASECLGRPQGAAGLVENLQDSFGHGVEGSELQAGVGGDRCAVSFDRAPQAPQGGNVLFGEVAHGAGLGDSALCFLMAAVLEIFAALEGGFVSGILDGIDQG